MLSTRQLYRSNNQPANYAALTQFAPEPLLQRLAELVGQLADVTGNSLGGTDRFGEGTADLDQFLGTDRLDRFSDPADRLVEPAAEFRAEAQCERRARQRQQFAHAVEAEHAEGIH
jgi:hypothetical protein